MLGLIFLTLITGWLTISWVTARKLSKNINPLLWNRVARAALFGAIAVAPITDEIVGRQQLYKLCEQTPVYLDPNWESSGEWVFSSSYSKIEHKAIPIEKVVYQYEDSSTKEPMFASGHYRSRGGFVYGFLGFGLGLGVSCQFDDPEEKRSLVSNKTNAKKEYVYSFNIGDGHRYNHISGKGIPTDENTLRFEVIDNAKSNEHVLRFGDGIDPQDITASREGYAIQLTHKNGNDSITFPNWYPNYGVSRIIFEDGTVYYAREFSEKLLVTRGTEGSDTLEGLPGHVSTLIGLGGDDLLTVTAGSSKLYGGAGNDVLQGGIDADLLVGDEGDDLIFGGPGVDVSIGGPGNDGHKDVEVLLFNKGDGHDSLAFSETAKLGVISIGKTPLSDLKVLLVKDDVLIKVGLSGSIQVTGPLPKKTILQVIEKGRKGAVLATAFDFNEIIRRLTSTGFGAIHAVDLSAYEVRLPPHDAYGGAIAAAYALEGSIERLKAENYKKFFTLSHRSAEPSSILPLVAAATKRASNNLND